MTLIRGIKEEDYFTQLIYEALKSLEEEIGGKIDEEIEGQTAAYLKNI